jgi:3-hydroxyacyl-[acyl-carrier-protein] dehydratase
LPGVLMCEAIAQMGAIAVLADGKFAGKIPLFGGLDGARFRRQVGPGDTLELHVELGRMSSRAGKGTGKAILNGQVACECDLMFVFVDA